MAETVTIKVQRFNPETDTEPRLQTYEVPYKEDWVLLDAITYIKDHLDPTLSYRWSCRMGICGSCGMNVNGYPRLTCSTHLRDFRAGMTVEPLANFPVIRDLVIDIDDFMAKLKSVKPWIVRQLEQPLGAGEFLQSNNQVDNYRQFSQCINCMLCYAACPVYGMENEFLGPAAIALARRYNNDSRDQGAADRVKVLAASDGIWDCSFVGECSAACPKGVDPAKAIQQTKFDTVNGFVMDAMLTPFGGRG
ncbi:MAG TPA: succinate dehydrogenase/fumarate reductase iron-sulfur subunit [Candidatus Dormibacteraeota bacterium]|nr:succinate dehydrogenase/fumarate reductase iron-sulfur subunit [Candidatus Dormibacteraeota bacterium]